MCGASPQVHDPLKQGLITYLVEIAREKGVSAYIGDGLNRWPAVHVQDAARLQACLREWVSGLPLQRGCRRRSAASRNRGRQSAGASTSQPLP